MQSSLPLPLRQTAESALDSVFDVAGAPAAPALVLLHTVASSRAWWLPQVPVLSQQHRVVVPDLPGHGVLAQQPFRFAATVPVIQQALTATADRRAILVGVSMGGYAAIEFAARHPDQVAGLVLSGCGANFTGIGAPIARGIAALLRVSKLLSAPMLHWIERLMLHPLPREQARAINRAGGYFDAWPACMRDLAGNDMHAKLRSYPGPTLILHGSNRLSRLSHAGLTKAAQNPTVAPIANAAHLPNIERADAYTQAIRAFASSVYRTPAYARG